MALGSRRRNKNEAAEAASVSPFRLTYMYRSVFLPAA